VGEQEGEPCATEHGEKASHGGDRKSNYHIDNLMLNDRPPHERLAGEYNASHATITRDAKFAEAVDSITAPVGEYARSIFFDSRLIGAALFNRRGAGEIAGRRAVGRFGTRLHTESTWRFGTLPTPEPAKRPYIQQPSFRRGNCISLLYTRRTT
jgi:hypothetical protein